MARRRDQHVNAAVVLASIQQTGAELIRQCGVAAAHFPEGDAIPRPVLLSVIASSADLHTTLLRYVSDLATNEITVAPKPEHSA